MRRSSSLFAFSGSGKAQRAFLLIGIHHAGDVRRRSRDVHTLEQFSLSETQDVTSSLPAAALTCDTKEWIMDYVIIFATVVMIAFYALIITRCLPTT
jgi:hypothetical protein